jgi:hypothetical protein
MSLVGNNSLKTFSRQQRIVGGVVFYVVRVVWKETRRLVLPSTSCLFMFHSREQQSASICNNMKMYLLMDVCWSEHVVQAASTSESEHSTKVVKIGLKHTGTAVIRTKLNPNWLNSTFPENGGGRATSTNYKFNVIFFFFYFLALKPNYWETWHALMDPPLWALTDLTQWPLA